MMSECPECGSNEIIPDLLIFGDILPHLRPAMVILEDPANKEEPVSVGFRAAVCGACGHTEIYTRIYKDLLEAHKKGFVSSEPD